MFFKRIALLGTHTNPQVADTLNQLITWLNQHQRELVLEQQTAAFIKNTTIQNNQLEALHKHCEVAIVVGGDGNLLAAARHFSMYNIPLIGINRGSLGFLTDITPQYLTEELLPVLEKKYIEEKRFLLTGNLRHQVGESHGSNALNDIVLSPGDLARMIEFEVFIDGHFVCNQRADGLIISTPTGSTAYALSGGGPIIHPSMQSIALVPMFPHNLTSRPLVVPDSSHIVIKLAPHLKTYPTVSFDSQLHFEIQPGDEIHIQQQTGHLRLLHPKHYDYYAVLRSKLNWGQQLY
ncbi:NAD(+) kinase [Piscirickettsia salmonis]|uniref:NAD(+) kinase n=1 Tax=Piscirickettsia salmonis TaxID=1238 RepID=UPI0007C8FA36|nr:putative inorganic polyphosphate/ATP-NAD kinase [Piscirickettsiaceae bacterium NZ-RLO1]